MDDIQEANSVSIEKESPEAPHTLRIVLLTILSVLLVIAAGVFVWYMFFFSPHTEQVPISTPVVVTSTTDDGMTTTTDPYDGMSFYERGEDAFGPFVRSSETSLKDYTQMTFGKEISVNWYSHGKEVSTEETSNIFGKISPTFSEDLQKLKRTGTEYDAQNIYNVYLYELGNITVPEVFENNIIYLVSFPSAGMGTSLMTQYVVFVDQLQAFVVISTYDDVSNGIDEIDINDYIKGVMILDIAPGIPETLSLPNNDGTLSFRHSLLANYYSFDYRAASTNAGGIVDVTTNEVVTGYNESDIAFTDPTYGPVYFVDNEYRLILDDGSVQIYDLIPHFLKDNTEAEEKDMYPYAYSAEVTWNSDFSQRQNMYVLGGDVMTGGCGRGIRLEENVVNDKEWFDEQALVQVGKTASGDPIYVLSGSKDRSIYKDFFAYGGDSVYLKDHPNMTYQELEAIPEATRYQEFLANDPIIFWKDAAGHWRSYFKAEYQSLAECGKPVIYLYPEKEMDVSVQVAPNGGFTYTDPVYPADGWSVRATPKGSLFSYADAMVYPYLFWEGHADGFGFSDRGWVFSRTTLLSDMTTLLTKAGLNAQETADFLEFWLPKMQEKPYVFVTFVNQRSFEAAAPLTISPRPDSVLRVFMSFTPLDTFKKVEPLPLSGFERKGFSVVEWGGVLEKY